jgi:tape measure domain-containing protein
MAVIDDKVVAMSFESSKFESGVNKTIASLEKLKSALHFPGAGKGLSEIDAAAKKVDLSHISKGVDGILGKLSALRVAALAVFTSIALKAVQAGTAFLKSFTLDPIKAGFKEYATNLNAIQTILANTQAAGTNLQDVNKALRELNEYSDKTIYNFSQMARNIGTFTAAGVELDVATQAIKGIANLAALSGSNAEQASTAMYQLSQAISAGSVKLQDWNSVVNAGMGGTVFQRALAQTAEAIGTLKEGTVKLEGPMKNVTIAGEAFRQSLSTPGKASWLTSEVLTKTLKQFTGDLSNAELAAMGFNNAQIKAIQQTAKTAMFAATEVKTLTQVLDVAKETAASGWAQTWQIIFGDFGEAKTTFTALSNAINGFINANADARNKVLGDWKALGGRTVLIDGIKTAFRNLSLIIAPIKEAFRDIFPAKTGKDLYRITVGFREFAQSLKPSAETVENLKRTFRGLFALLDIGKQIIGGLFGVFRRLFGIWAEGAGGFLAFTGNIGDFLVKLDETLKKGDKLNRFFEKMGDILAVPVEMLKTLSSTLVGLFSGALPGGLAKQLSGMGETLNPIEIFANNLAKTWNRLLNTFNDTLDALGPAFDAIISLIQGLGTAIGEAASNMNFDAILQVINTGLFAGIALMLKNFFGKGSLLEQVSKGFGGGIIANIAGSFKALEGSMVALQNNIKAKTLKEIAIAIALLTASVVALTFVDPEKVNAAIASIAFMMGELLAAMAIMDKIAKTGGFIKLPVIAAGMVILAGAIDLLVIAVFALSKLSWDELLRGLTGVGALLGGISAASVVLSANAGGMIRAGIGITAIAIAMNLLALAVRQLSGLSWQEMVRGLTGVGTGLAAVAGAMKIMPKGMILQSAALIAIATSLNILARAVEKFSGMSWSAMGKGLAGIGGALVIIAAAMQLMPKSMVLTAAGLMLVALSLGKISAAVQSMGDMSITQIAKGLGTLAGSLAILAAALYLMSGTFAGAAALAAAAAGLALLAPAIALLGKMSWGQIIKGLVSLGAALAIIAISATALAPAAPAMLAFGAALILVGAGLALAGAGIALIGIGLSAIAVAGPTAVGILIAAFTNLTKAMIENAKLLVLGLLEIVRAFAATAPKFVDALVKIVGALADGIVKASPKIAEAFTALLTVAINVLQQNQGRIIQAGFDLLIALLQGIKNNIPNLVTLIVDIIATLLRTIAGQLGKIITAGLSILTSLIKGIVGGYALVVTTVLQIIVKFIGAITSNLGKIVTAGITMLATLLKAIASRIGDVIRLGTDIITAFVKSIGDSAEKVVRIARETAGKFINTLASEIVKLADDVFNAMITLLNGLAKVIEDRSPELRAAAFRVGVAIVDGMTGGLVSKAEALYNKITGIMDKAMGLLHKIPGVKSPSTVTTDIGENIILGLVQGLDKTAPKAYESAEAMSLGLIKKFNDVFQTHSPSKVMAEIGKFVGQGFAQGLRGSVSDINSAWAELNEQLTDAMTTARETIISEQEKLEKLRKEKKPDLEAIKAAQAAILENQRILRLSTETHNALTGVLKKEKTELLGLVTQYENVTTRLDKAREVLAQAKADRDALIKSYSEQYATLPEITKEDPEGLAMSGEAQLEAYKQGLITQTEAVEQYRKTLEKLRQLGLDDATYQKLLEEGTVDQEFATALLAGGKTAIEGLGKLDTQLKRESDKLGKQAGLNLKQSGVKAAQGFVNGLVSQEQKLKKQIEALARRLVAAFNAILEVKSPSRVFMEIGVNVVKGLAKGIADSSKMMVTAIEDSAKDALNAMKSSMRNISDIVTNELNPNPVITPVLDLTLVRSQAGELGALTNLTPITAAASYGQAALISAEQLAAQAEALAVSPGGTSLRFEQNNYSPEALTEIEIYRQTKNQLSQLKSALALN